MLEIIKCPSRSQEVLTKASRVTLRIPAARRTLRQRVVQAAAAQELQRIRELLSRRPTVGSLRNPGWCFIPARTLSPATWSILVFRRWWHRTTHSTRHFISGAWSRVSPYRNFTVRRFIWTFTDLGQVYVIWTLSGVNENQQVVQTTNAIGVGNAVPTYRIFSIALDFGPLSMMNQQLSVYRAANAGPLSVVQMYGSLEVEENTL